MATNQRTTDADADAESLAELLMASPDTDRVRVESHKPLGGYPNGHVRVTADVPTRNSAHVKNAATEQGFRVRSTPTSDPSEVRLMLIKEYRD